MTAQPLDAQAGLGVEMDAARVRAAMLLGRAHPLDRLTLHRAPVGPHLARNPAHAGKAIRPLGRRSAQAADRGSRRLQLGATHLTGDDQDTDVGEQPPRALPATACTMVSEWVPNTRKTADIAAAARDVRSSDAAQVPEVEVDQRACDEQVADREEEKGDVRPMAPATTPIRGIKMASIAALRATAPLRAGSGAALRRGSRCSARASERGPPSRRRGRAPRSTSAEAP